MMEIKKMDRKAHGLALLLLAALAPAVADAAVSIDLYRSSAGSQERDIYLQGLASAAMTLNVASEMTTNRAIFCPPNDISNLVQFAQRVIDRALRENAANSKGSEDVAAVFVSGLLKQYPCR